MRTIISFVLLTFLFISTAQADSASKLQRELNKIRSMSAQFTQTVLRHGEVVQRTQGTVKIYRPGRFRWDISAPSKQIIIADGMKLWQYDIALKQVQVSRQSQLRGTPSLFLASSLHGLGRQYHVVRNGSRYTLTSKDRDDDAHTVDIWLQQQKILKINVRDALGNATSLEFKSIRVNIPMNQQNFQFTPPAGVDVIS